MTREKKVQSPGGKSGCHAVAAGGRASARVEGEWLDRMLWAGEHAGHVHMQTVPVERSDI